MQRIYVCLFIHAVKQSFFSFAFSCFFFSLLFFGRIFFVFLYVFARFVCVLWGSKISIFCSWGLRGLSHTHTHTRIIALPETLLYIRLIPRSYIFFFLYDNHRCEVPLKHVSFFFSLFVAYLASFCLLSTAIGSANQWQRISFFFFLFHYLHVFFFFTTLLLFAVHTDLRAFAEGKAYQ